MSFKLISLLLIMSFFGGNLFASKMSQRDLDRIYLSAKKKALNSKNKSAVRSFKLLIKNSYRLDETHIDLARVYYQNRQFKKSIEYYSKVSKSSDMWLLALEERAWAYMKTAQYDLALAESLTLLSSVFDQYVSSGSYYLASLSRYYVCDYSGVFNITKQMKSRYHERIISLQSISSNKQNNSDIENIIKMSRQSDLNFQSAAPYLKTLPSYFYRDKILKALMLKVKNKKLNSKGLSPLKRKIYKRFSLLARRNLKVINNNIDKLQVVEAEVIQRVFEQSNKPVMSNAKTGTTKNLEILTFPVNDNEVWIDELGSFKVKASSCPKVKGA